MEQGVTETMEYPNLILSFNKRGRCLVLVIIIGVYLSFAHGGIYYAFKVDV